VLLYARVVLLVALGASPGCAESLSGTLVDLEGPSGRVEQAGPWSVAVVSRRSEVTLHVSDDGGPFEARRMVALGDDLYVAALPDRPQGWTVRYYAESGDAVLPEGSPGRARTFTVGPPDIIAPPVRRTGGCTLAFRYPVAGMTLGPADDAAPQAGFQITAVLDAELDDGAPVALRVGDVGYAAVAVGGQVAFESVTLAPGPNGLRADAALADGDACRAELAVTVEVEVAIEP
jgi:hypothetical protein